MASQQPLRVTTSSKASEPFVFTGFLFAMRMQYILKYVDERNLNTAMDILADTVKFISMVNIGEMARKAYGNPKIKDVIKIGELNISEFYPELRAKRDFIHSMAVMDTLNVAYKELINIGAEMYHSDYEVGFLDKIIPELDLIANNIYHDHNRCQIELFFLMIRICRGDGMVAEFKTNYIANLEELTSTIKNGDTILGNLSYNVKKELFTVQFGTHKPYNTKNATKAVNVALSKI